MVDTEEEFLQTTRIIDASLNRIGEGLRFLKENARMLINDRAMTSEFKAPRHQLPVTDQDFQEKLLNPRKADNDVGSDLKVLEEYQAESLPGQLPANSRRIQKSLRTLEEITGNPGFLKEQNTDVFRKSRFSVCPRVKGNYFRFMIGDKADRLHFGQDELPVAAAGGINTEYSAEAL